MWIKICGMTSVEAVATAVEAGADALGFVFAESPRRVTPQGAASLARRARGRVRCVAVTRHPSQATIDEILEAFAPDVLQTDAADFAGLHLPAALERLPVVRAGERLPDPLPSRLLFEGPASGTGVPGDWSAAAALAPRASVVLAGGLTPANVAAAIVAVQPFGVDVSSGVEARPGVKSPAAIESFVSAARAAAAARAEPRGMP
jgi:phosphoribosylanthranilate isomerase